MNTNATKASTAGHVNDRAMGGHTKKSESSKKKGGKNRPALSESTFEPLGEAELSSTQPNQPITGLSLAKNPAGVDVPSRLRYPALSMEHATESFAVAPPSLPKPDPPKLEIVGKIESLVQGMPSSSTVRSQKRDSASAEHTAAAFGNVTLGLTEDTEDYPSDEKPLQLTAPPGGWNNLQEFFVDWAKQEKKDTGKHPSWYHGPDADTEEGKDSAEAMGKKEDEVERTEGAEAEFKVAAGPGTEHCTPAEAEDSDDEHTPIEAEYQNELAATGESSRGFEGKGKGKAKENEIEQGMATTEQGYGLEKLQRKVLKRVEARTQGKTKDDKTEDVAERIDEELAKGEVEMSVEQGTGLEKGVLGEGSKNKKKKKSKSKSKSKGKGKERAE